MLVLHRRRASQSGKVNGMFIVFLLVTFLLGCVAVTFLPPWMRNRRIQAAMQEQVFQAWNIRDDKLIKGNIKRRRDELWGKEPNPDGKYPEFEETDVEVERDTEANLIKIDLTYTVVTKYPFLDKTHEMTFVNHAEGTTLSPAALEKGEKKSEFWKWLTE